MKLAATAIPDVAVVHLDIWRDSRGFFSERFHEEKCKAIGLPVFFPQDNYSRSYPNVLRGLHFQHTPAQGKFVGVIHGRIWDVAVDVRPDSPTFGKYVAEELNDDNGKMLWIPPGFAHGFLVLGDKPADVYYKVTSLYHAKGESGLAWDDPELAIDWPIEDRSLLVISERDRNLPRFEYYRKNPPIW